jgi:hypothetical protein
MGKRRRGPETYVRRGPTREPYDVVLIVCEGAKTEPNYFKRLKLAYRLSNANIHVLQAPGCDPMSIVQFAESELQKGVYDKVFCVFDRDGHANFSQAIRRVEDSAAGRERKLLAVVSWPCFEIWILLHFVYTTQAFTASGGRSPCENVIRAIREHFPAYAKGHLTVFDELHPKIDSAVERGRQLAQYNRDTGSSNPATALHELVEYLRNLHRT